MEAKVAIVILENGSVQFTGVDIGSGEILDAREALMNVVRNQKISFPKRAPEPNEQPKKDLDTGDSNLEG